MPLKRFLPSCSRRRHTYQVLTKRPERLAQLASHRPVPPNVWIGPLLGPLADLSLDGIHWVIVGGESGPQARWVLEIRDQCVARGIPFFFK
jgi:protein gp37